MSTGLMQGKVEERTLIVMDAFALPVDGTETQVSAQDSAYAYMFSYQELIKKVGRLENVMGWYHSHPGYGCWLSGIDVGTQTLHQTGNEPFLAVVVDPVRTISAGKVELGAFRCYPAGYHPPNEPVSEYQTIPLDKIEDFGVHSKQYYPLEVTYFKSALDRQLLTLLWNTYWVNTLSSSPLLANAGYVTGQITDLAEKLEQADTFHLVHSRSVGGNGDSRKDKLAKCAKDGARLVMEDLRGLISQTLKDEVFNKGPSAPVAASAPPS